jgi:hypothetical protein
MKTIILPARMKVLQTFVDEIATATPHDPILDVEM